MYIRPANKKDLPKVIKIIEDAFHRHYAAAGEFYSIQQFVDPNYATATGPYYSLKSFIKSMVSDLKHKLSKPFEFLVAEENKKIIGFIILEKNAGNFWISNVMVKKEFQKNGVGKQLFNFAVKNKKPLYLWVNTKNPAIKFWKKLGFKEILRESLMIKK